MGAVHEPPLHCRPVRINGTFHGTLSASQFPQKTLHGNTEMPIRIGDYLALDGAKLRYRCWSDGDPPDAVIYLHGIESHSEWFAECAEEIARRHAAVYALDRRGSGMNEDSRGHCRDFLQLVDDVLQFVHLIGSSHARFHLVALSWGAKLAVAFDMLHPKTIGTLTLIAPGLFPRVMPQVGERISIAVDALFRPRSLHPIPITDEMFTSLPKYLAYIAADPLRLRKVTARFYLETVRLDRFLRRRAYQWSAATQVLLAERDAIVDNLRVQRMFETLKVEPKRISIYEGCNHSLQFERPVEVANDIIDWMRMG